MPNLSYPAALDALYALVNYETRPPGSLQVFDLGRVEELLARLGHPQRALAVVHVGGTKGKGSTAAMISSILQAAGHRVGLYTSPHLHTFRERIRIDGQLISETDVIAGVSGLLPEAQALPGITTFEATTALAFSYFAQNQVDLAVLEVGLGGRLDATNVVDPRVAVLTLIGYDHTALLGTRLEQIAVEKAGIIKPGRPLVSAPQRPAALRVIRRTCRERNAPLIEVASTWRWERRQADLEGQWFDLKNAESLEELRIPLLGAHQLVNAATAVAATAVLRQDSLHVPPTAVVRGLADIQWPGRLEVLSRTPLLVVDGAHNPESAEALVRAVREYFTFRRAILVYGSLADKNHAVILRHLRHLSPRIILTRFPHPRAASLHDLQSAAQRARFQARWLVENVPLAVEQALAIAEPDDLVLASGSISLAGQVRAYWLKKEGTPFEEDPRRMS